MDAPFPFGLPLPTAFYMTLYLGTLMIHIVFMNYVLAGSAYLAAINILRGHAADKNPLAAVLSDWMPFMLSAAITAGIAPLLFLQILYKEHFYTANLLLFYRWMAILPVLIIGFYLSYLLKAKIVRQWPLAVRAAVGCGVFACFTFVGWSWVENHLLSVQPEVWVSQYESESILFRSPELAPRLTLWFVAAFPTMALVVGWQLLCKRPASGGAAVEGSGSRQASVLAVAGILLSVIVGGGYVAMMTPTARATIFGPMARIYLFLAILGGFIQLIAWVVVFLQARITRRWLIVSTVGLVINFVGMGVINESTRLAALDIQTLYAKHAEAWRVSGAGWFFFFLLLNVGLMAYCLRLANRPSAFENDGEANAGNG